MSSASIANCDDPEVLKTLISDLESEVKERTSENACFEAEIRALQRRLVKKDAEILRQERELHKLRVRNRRQFLRTELREPRIVESSTRGNSLCNLSPPAQLKT